MPCDALFDPNASWNSIHHVASYSIWKGIDMSQSYLKAMRVLSVLANGLRCLLEIGILSVSLEGAKSSHGDLVTLARLDMEMTRLL